jgi:hypothetical protein
MILTRYADDIVVGFEHEADARRFWDDMRKRFEEVWLHKTSPLVSGSARGRKGSFYCRTENAPDRT